VKKNKITYSKDQSREKKSNPFSNESYYARLESSNGSMSKFKITEENNYWKIRPDEEESRNHKI
jgi:hypothetical protein